MDNFQIETAQNVTIRQNAAGVWDRILAYIVDALVIIVYELLAVLIMSSLNIEAFSEMVYMMVLGLPLLLYFLLWETFWDGRTPGKAAMQLRVVKLDGSKPSFSVYLIRWLLRFVDITISSGSIAIVTILFNGKGQRLGDMAAGSTVITEKKQVGFQQTLMVQVPDGYVPKYPQVTILKDPEIQTIKNLFQDAKRNGNYNIIISLSEKVAGLLEVTPEERPADFISTVLKDYNYYTQQV